MKLSDILKTWIQENLLLFKDPDKFRKVTTVRVVALVTIAVLCVTIYQLFTGMIRFEMGMVVGLFAIFISYLFFSTSQRNSDTQMRNLQDFLRSFRQESQRGIERVQDGLGRVERKGRLTGFDSTGIARDFSGGQEPVPSGDIFKSLSSGLKVSHKQIVIAMSKLGTPFSAEDTVICRFELNGAGFEPIIQFPDEMQGLVEVGLANYDPSKRMLELTEQGGEFARWLCDHGEEAQYFESPQIIKWGEPALFQDSRPSWEWHSPG